MRYDFIGKMLRLPLDILARLYLYGTAIVLITVVVAIKIAAKITGDGAGASA